MTTEETPAMLYNIKKKIDLEKERNENFYEMLEEIEKDELKGPDVYYFTGPSGKGKTYSALKKAK